MRLDELKFDQPYKWQIAYRARGGEDISATFTTGQQLEGKPIKYEINLAWDWGRAGWTGYQLDFLLDPDLINAVRAQQPDKTLYATNILGLGDATRVFATVMDFLVWFLKNNRVAYVEFDADPGEHSRVRLYDRFIKWLQSGRFSHMIEGYDGVARDTTYYIFNKQWALDPAQHSGRVTHWLPAKYLRAPQKD